MKYFSEYYKSNAIRKNFINIELLVNHDKRLIFNLIDKCGGTTLRETLPKFGYKLINFNKPIDDDMHYEIKPDISEYKKIAFIREPESRYLVGLYQYLNFHLNISLNELINQVDSDKIIFDSHTLPQNKFILKNFFNDRNFKLIKFDSFSESVKKIDSSIIDLPKLWSHKQTDKGYSMKLAKDIFDTRIKKNLLRKVYKKDFDLYNSAMVDI
jgi:hypothetical protein